MQSVLVANRGEIAVRVIRACRELGLRSVSVYSEADRMAPHVLLADEAYCVGPAPASESYLRPDRILEAAAAAKVDAVHPGYGFLSERAAFARAVEDQGLLFVGPTADTIAAMGDKSEARRRMKAVGIPVVPGTEGPVEGDSESLDLAAEVGYPLLIKAVAGGGGKGMRVVESETELLRSLEAARREALGAFGDDAVYLERFLERPRHIEIQLLGDGQGGVVHLGERECSIQRRHQKLVEEAPSPAISPETRAKMGEAAVRAGESVGYRGAGTVEFLVQNDAFFFLEMNTRIQVEHPVTEMVTGIDLVQWQLRIAAGEVLPFGQDDIEFTGHSIECRITAEDVAGGFLPATGQVRHLGVPGGPGVRWDGGITEGTEVGLHYDSLLGKLIVHAPTREEAINRLERALDELAILGVETTTSFLGRLVRESDFRAGRLSIRYLEEHPELLEDPAGIGDLDTPDAASVTAAALAALFETEWRKTRTSPSPVDAPPVLSPWQSAIRGGPWGPER